LYRLCDKLYFYQGDHNSESVEDNCTMRGITLEQHRELNEYFKDRGVIATLHHLNNYDGGEILHQFLLPPLPEKKVPGPRKPRASRRTGRRREDTMTVFKTKAAFEKHLKKHQAGVIPLTRTRNIPFSRDDHDDNVAFLAIARTALGKLCADICIEAGLKKLGRLDPESTIFWRVKQAAPCEEEMASRHGKMPYEWYFCVYDYASYVNIKANFKMIQDPISCDITAMCYVSPSKTPLPCRPPLRQQRQLQ
jgi:hypothetical protein